ncbi:YlzJ-like family protein [Anaeroselena agilis]|uniref:YlzJ-like family protein n=1 Tax=Anaeroselena agilis TaxID=3063788 RepID=A0ABU3NX15_9FIRM|nr:YlzJ-like family protein [Selenomonadales bacterium 4137-cl]
MSVLWTVLPAELVLDGFEKSPVYEEAEIAGAKVMVEKVAPYECRIVRLLSTAPDDFLRPELQPGVTLSYKPSLAAGDLR